MNAAQPGWGVLGLSRSCATGVRERLGPRRALSLHEGRLGEIPST